MLMWKCSWPLLQSVRTSSILHSSPPNLLFICSIKYDAPFFNYRIIDTNELIIHIHIAGSLS
jgi:hypothetical protein